MWQKLFDAWRNFCAVFQKGCFQDSHAHHHTMFSIVSTLIYTLFLHAVSSIHLFRSHRQPPVRGWHPTVVCFPEHEWRGALSTHLDLSCLRGKMSIQITGPFLKIRFLLLLLTGLNSLNVSDMTSLLELAVCKHPLVLWVVSSLCCFFGCAKGFFFNSCALKMGVFDYLLFFQYKT